MMLGERGRYGCSLRDYICVCRSMEGVSSGSASKKKENSSLVTKSITNRRTRAFFHPVFHPDLR